MSRVGRHGSYAGINEFFRLNLNEWELSEVLNSYPLRRIRARNWKNALTYERSCNVLVSVSDDSCITSSGRFGSCFRSRKGVYNRLKWNLRYKYLQSLYEPRNTFLDSSQITVVWHLRVGDIKLHQGDQQYYYNLFNVIQVLLQDTRWHIFFLFESKELRPHPPRGYEFLNNLDNVTFYPNKDVLFTLFHMINSDLLITSGSSLASFAALIAMKPVVLSSCPKEGCRYGVMEVSEHVPVSKKGTIPNLPLVQSIVQLKLRLKQQMANRQIQRWISPVFVFHTL
mmetsp:Transcript_35231/g.83560  ORF Transcript_35231/g.83560 Transcript_35231/m.83560 type:complete len:283 (-) Transcript_35231:1611-2459(-)